MKFSTFVNWGNKIYHRQGRRYVIAMNARFSPIRVNDEIINPGCFYIDNEESFNKYADQDQVIVRYAE